MLLTMLFFACQADKIDTANADTDTATNTNAEPAEEEENEDTSNPTPFDPMSGTISGTIDILLYTSGADGERESISWDEAYAGVFPFGKLFVAA